MATETKRLHIVVDISDEWWLTKKPAEEVAENLLTAFGEYHCIGTTVEAHWEET